MAPSRRTSNGRSPLLNPQRQITSFFSKASSSASQPSAASPSPLSVSSKLKPSPNPGPNPKHSSSSPEPHTPSPLQTKPRKPLLVIGGPVPSSSPTTTDFVKKSYGQEVVNKRIKVYWPLDKCWYEGVVKSYDKVSEKHLVQYDDADEELLSLKEEKIDLIDEPVKKLRRLRRVSMIEDEEDKEEEKLDDSLSGGDDSEDEDWGKSAEKEVIEEEDDEEDMDLVAEEQDDNDGVGSRKRSVSQKAESMKRKARGGANLDSISNKKSRSGNGDVKKIVHMASFDDSAEKLVEANTNSVDCK